MGRVAALILSLAALGALSALLVWFVFTVVNIARAAYQRHKDGNERHV